MNPRTKLAALMAAGALVLAFGSVTTAAPPTYEIAMSKTASPDQVPVGGGTVTYTIQVWPTGSGFFQVVVVDDGMPGCTLSGPTGDTADATKLSPGETWTYTCTVNGVTPGTENTATVNACHDGGGGCGGESHDASAEASETVTEGEGPEPTDEPEPTDLVEPSGDVVEPTGDVVEPTGDEGGIGASQPTTDTFVSGSGRPGDRSWMLVIALGLLLASIVVVSPSKGSRERRT